jgi:hypothetical protein
VVGGLHFTPVELRETLQEVKVNADLRLSINISILEASRF